MTEPDIHVMPTFEGELEHIESDICWCSPAIDFDPETYKCRVIIHNRPKECEQ